VAPVTDHGASERPEVDLGKLADLATPMALRVAATLRIADHISAGTRTAENLAAAVGADADALNRVLRHLVTSGVFSRDEAGAYALTSGGEALLNGHPRGLCAVLDLEGAVGRADLSFTHLLHSVRTGRAAFPKQFGGSFWDDLRADPSRGASFDAQMGQDIAADADAIVAAFDWGSLGHVVDVGGGNGTLLAALLDAHPSLYGTLFDQQPTIRMARGSAAIGRLADRMRLAEGSFFEALPPDAGGYLLSAVIHDWDDESARAILRRCKDAAGAKGSVFIIEKIGADGESPRTEMDLRMLVYFGGKERGLTELTALSESVGLFAVGMHPAGLLSIIELRAPETAVGFS
jgi:predicted transcriptional regulator